MRFPCGTIKTPKRIAGYLNSINSRDKNKKQVQFEGYMCIYFEGYLICENIKNLHAFLASLLYSSVSQFALDDSTLFKFHN